MGGVRQTSSTRARDGGSTERPSTDSTRDKLLLAGTEVFAKRGFQAATVREISARAGANVAAVNYHFGDKLGLYVEVLRAAVAAADPVVVRAAADRSAEPEELLRLIIRTRVHGLQGADQATRLLVHELNRPTPALARVVDETLRPLYDRLRAVVGMILDLPADDDDTRLCVSSIIGQIVHYAVARPILARLWPQLKMTPEQLDRIADHIADFSLAYLRTFKPARAPAASSGMERRRT
jgi:TetR/AcrR family transcriptional regulator, regulator of cefoperazone and chloramphenicol sensitivity